MLCWTLARISHQRLLQLWLLGLVLCAIAVVISIYFVDRPVATLVAATARQSPIDSWIAHALEFLATVAVIAPLFLIVCACLVIAGRGLPPWTKTPLLCCWGIVWAIAATTAFKLIFGRAEVDPYLKDGIYQFNWFHGTHWYEAFPSGTATISAALMTVLWMRIPSWRWLWLLVFLLPTIGVVVTNEHFVGDVIAGGYLGVSIGWMTVALLQPG